MKRGMSKRRVLGLASGLALLATSAVHAVVIYVDDDAPPGGDGLSWNTANRFLQDALTFANLPANNVTEIRIGQGVYKPDRDEANPEGTGDRAASFVLADGSVLLGGFAGVGAPDPDERSITQYETILSGDLSGDDLQGFLNRGENSFHVVRMEQPGAVVLDGLTIAKGHANAPYENIFSENALGGGIRAPQSDLAILRCTLCDNYARGLGGAIFGNSSQQIISIVQSTLNDNRAGTGGALGTSYNSSSTINECTFQNNRAKRGGAIFCQRLTVADSTFEGNTATLEGGGAISSSTVHLADCDFFANSAKSGGALSIYGGEGIVSQCVFEFNSADYGGAAYLAGDDVTHFVECSFTSNHGRRQGGAMAVAGGSPTLEDCVFESNNGTYGGGALANWAWEDDDYLYYCRPTVRRCSFLHNTGRAGGAMHNRAAEPTLIDCRFESNSATVRGGAVANFGDSFFIDDYYGYWVHIPGRPRLYNCVLWNNVAGKGGAMYSNFSVATLTNCTLAANQATLGGDVLSESSATLRVYNSIVRGDAPASLAGAGIRTVRYSNIHGGHSGIGNIDADPLYVDYVNGDVRLLSGSPCNDAGRNAYLPGIILTDIAGNPRYRDDPATPNTGVGSPMVIDIGAYEY